MDSFPLDGSDNQFFKLTLFLEKNQTYLCFTKKWRLVTMVSGFFIQIYCRVYCTKCVFSIVYESFMQNRLFHRIILFEEEKENRKYFLSSNQGIIIYTKQKNISTSPIHPCSYIQQNNITKLTMTMRQNEDRTQ